MKIVIFYYTGTGNSLWSARLLAEKLDGAALRPLKAADPFSAADADAVGFVFPVHMWGIPGPVLEFLEKLTLKPEVYYFALAVNAGQVSRTLIQLRGLLSRRGVKLAAGFSIVMPSNYIPWGGPGTEKRRHNLFRIGCEKINEAAAFIAGQKSGMIERGPAWQRILFTAIYKMTFKQVKTMDKGFWCDDKCNACGICVKVCPAKNIILEAGKPLWQHRCEQCLACIQWCPQESIQYGKKTPAYERYHHPEVQLNDMIA
ncbi:MAG: EFR1 family ferrodoxin [Candidatus Aminicenantes bacterium]|nr:EFR1 family ferrodoxin [Candidatus Aminicenantes bacterium]